MERTEIKNIITIGTSAGGIAAVSRLLGTFNTDLDAAIFIVIHISRNSMMEVILHQLQKQTVLPCTSPKDGEEIENQTIYIAPADHHMMIEKGKINIKKGAYENHWRPSIDVLFRSAAAAYDSCVTGIILTGLLDDGTSGMSAIKRCGGICIVQEPLDAEFPDMPNNVLVNVAVDYKVPIAEMGYILSDLFSRANCQPGTVPADVKLESEIARRMSSNVEDLEQLGTLTSFTCPDCGGVLAKVTHDSVVRYRCYTGHAFTEKALENEQIKGIEDSLWVAIRMLEERKNLLVSMTAQMKERTGQNLVAMPKQQRAAEIKIHIDRLKSMLLSVGEEEQNNKEHI